MHHPSDGMGSMGRVSGRRRPISRGRVEVLKVVSKLVSHLGSDPRGVLRPVVGRSEDVPFFERG